MKKESGMTLITVVMMIIVIAVIASISIISSRDVLTEAKEEAKLQNKVAVESVVSKYAAKIQTSGYLTPAMQEMPGIHNPTLKHNVLNAEGVLESKDENVGNDWYLLLQEHLEEMGITYAKQNYLVNYRKNIVIPITENDDVFAELAMYKEPGEDD